MDFLSGCSDYHIVFINRVKEILFTNHLLNVTCRKQAE